MMTPSIAQLLMSGGQAPPRMRQRDPLVGQMPGMQHVPERRVDPPVHQGMNNAQYRRWQKAQPPRLPGAGYGVGPLA